MKPRVFVSSTYYDLKHVRERIERFFEKYAYEAVLFESDNVVFEHDKPIDLSCYNEVKLCHMMVLIIGGRYGSSVSGEDLEEKKGVYNEYVSITRKEFETAQKMKMPIFIFIDKNVYAEYHTFKSNSTFFDNQEALEKSQFKFAHADDSNVFKFINQIRGLAIKTFDKVEDIEQYLNNQLAGFMYLYLQQLQDESKEGKVLDSVSELQSISKQMNEMLGAVGKNLIDEDKFTEVIFNQNRILLDFFVTQFIDNISFQNELVDFTKKQTQLVFSAFKSTLLNYELLNEIEGIEDWKKAWNMRSELQHVLQKELHSIDPTLTIKSLNFIKLTASYFNKIYPIINSNPELNTIFENKMIEELNDKIMDLPF